jgi:hypothetical protein
MAAPVRPMTGTIASAKIGATFPRRSLKNCFADMTDILQTKLIDSICLKHVEIGLWKSFKL